MKHLIVYQIKKFFQVSPPLQLEAQTGSKIFSEDDVTGGTFYVTGRTFLVGNLRKRSVFTCFRTFVNFFGQNEWHICFSQPILY